MSWLKKPLAQSNGGVVQVWVTPGWRTLAAKMAHNGTRAEPYALIEG